MITQTYREIPTLLASAAVGIKHNPEKDTFWYFKPGCQDMAHAIWQPVHGGKFWLIVFPNLSTNGEQVAAIARSLQQATDIATQRTMRRAIASFVFYDNGDERFAEEVKMLIPSWDIRHEYLKLKQSCQDWATFLSPDFQGWICEAVEWADGSPSPFDEF